jgi:hypothetical protein
MTLMYCYAIPVIPGRPTDLGFTRDRHLKAPRSAKADLAGPGPESILPVWGYGFRDHAFGAPRNDSKKVHH